MNNNTTNQINEYDAIVINNLEVEGLKGWALVAQIILNNKEGNYRLYNMVTGGIGKMNPIGNLLAKMGIE